MDKLSPLLISAKSTIKDAMKQLNDNSTQIVLVVDKKKRLIGTITDGDIRRALLDNVSLNSSINRIVNRNAKFLYEEQKGKASELMKKHVIFHVPILNKAREVVDIVLWKNLKAGARPGNHCSKENSVFILAGGEGARLDPFTKILPKPLIPIEDKPIIEIVIENFKKFGFNKFILSLNYKGKMIKMYFNENPQHYNISYVEEKEFLGTAGSLRLVKGKINSSLIVSNCDVILDINFDELLSYHLAKKNDFTVVGIIRHVKIPYGIVKIKDGNLVKFTEKPEYDFIVNAGTYVIEPKVIGLIRKNERIDMPELISRAKKRGYRVGVYPVSSDWIDVGQWEEYKIALEHFREKVIA